MEGESTATNQYSIQSILWITAAVAMLLAYVQHLDPMSVSLLAACVIMWLVSSTIFSIASRQPKAVVYWTGLIVLEAFLAVSGMRVFNLTQGYGWGLVGAACGGFCASQLVQRSLTGSTISGVLGAASMMLVLKYFGVTLDIERWLDFIGAAVVGCILWYFVRFMRWFVVASHQSHAVVAAWLTLSVLVGNWLVAYLGY